MRFRDLLTEKFNAFPGALAFTDWSDFRAKLESAKGVKTEAELFRILGLDPKLFDELIESAIRAWRDSTSTSILQAIAHLDDRFPTPGEQIFANPIWQTRFLMKAPRGRFGIMTQRVRDNQGMPIKLTSDAFAMTTTNVEQVNTLLQYLFLYNYMNRHFNFFEAKVAKTLYRGIRASDLLNHAIISPMVQPFYQNKELKYAEKRRQAMDVLFQYLYQNGFSAIIDSPILSFTASLPTAKYFTRGEGFVLQVPSSAVRIISSEVHDPARLHGATFETRGKDEREYIARLPDDFRPSPANIIVNDDQYYLASNSPLAVGLLSHDDKEAHYVMNGVKIVAHWSWNNSGIGGKLVFRANDDWSMGRGEFRKNHGFDPIPNEKTLGSVQGFEIKERKRW